jgi:hypothetical protein
MTHFFLAVASFIDPLRNPSRSIETYVKPNEWLIEN